MRQSHYNELMKIAADLETEGDDDIAKSLRYAIANPSFNGAELQSDRDSWRALAESAKRDLAALAPTAEQAEGDANAAELSKMLANIIHDQTVAMQSALIEWQHGKGAEAGFSWIVNTLEGPGHLPDFDAPYGKQAQFWFDANRAEPFPKCFCGNPSHQLWMGQGFCCNEHYAEAKAQHDAAPAASTSDLS
jgi:hypothetical protein